MDEERNDLINENLGDSGFEKSGKIVNNYYERKGNSIGIAGTIISLIGVIIAIIFVGAIGSMF